MASKLLSVIVRSREGIKWEGEAESVTSVNEVGPFDVLPLHTNFVALINNRLTIHKPGGQNEEINLKKGVMTVTSNKVTVLIGV